MHGTGQVVGGPVHGDGVNIVAEPVSEAPAPVTVIVMLWGGIGVLLKPVRGPMTSAQVNVERDLMTQALANLIVNATQAIDGNDGTIVVRARQSGNGIELEVMDDGPGFDAEVIALAVDVMRVHVALGALEQSIRGMRATPETLESRLEEAYNRLSIQSPGVTPADFTTAIMNAVAPPQPA